MCLGVTISLFEIDILHSYIFAQTVMFVAYSWIIFYLLGSNVFLGNNVGWRCAYYSLFSTHFWLNGKGTFILFIISRGVCILYMIMTEFVDTYNHDYKRKQIHFCFSSIYKMAKLKGCMHTYFFLNLRDGVIIFSWQCFS